MNSEDPWDAAEKALEELVQYHSNRVLKEGRRRVPTLTPEDMWQPNDYPELEGDPEFRYEEGMWHGALSAQSALKALRGEAQAAPQ